MLFNSYEFILLFLPIALVLHYGAVKHSGVSDRIVLLVVSVAYYFFAGVDFLAYLVASVMVSYMLLQAVRRTHGRCRRVWLSLAIVLNVGALAVAKYCDFFIANVNLVFQTDIRLIQLVAPLGISFFTFSQVAFVIGVARNEILKVSLVDYALYVLYFPKLLMGPITEPRAFMDQLDSVCRVDWSEMSGGLQRFFFGLFKKVVFADAFARTVAYGFSGESIPSMVDVIVISLAYTFEIYFDFSGYTDMAIGISRMFGINLPENFDSPYRALSVRDFWKRWHLTLTGFLTKYVYFPLGGSRAGVLRTYANIMVVFLVSGLWHGASWTFIVWGLLHGAFMVRDRVMERFDSKIPRIVRWAVMFALTNLLWLLFRSVDISQFYGMIASLCSFTMTLDPVLTHTVTDPLPLWALLVFAAFVCLALQNTSRRVFRAGGVQALLTVLIAVWSLLSIGGSSSFVYFNF